MRERSVNVDGQRVGVASAHCGVSEANFGPSPRPKNTLHRSESIGELFRLLHDPVYESADRRKGLIFGKIPMPAAAGRYRRCDLGLRQATEPQT